MLPEQKGSLCLQRAQTAASAVIRYLDNNLWDKLAVKAISKMPKYVLFSECSNMLRDFAFVNSQMQHQTGDFREEDEKASPARQKQIAGFAELIKKEMNHSAPKINEETPRKPTNSQTKRKPERTQALSTSSYVAETKINRCFRVFISEPQNQEETKSEDVMRVNKFQMLRYNQQMEKVQKQQRLITEQRKLIQQKKARQSKEFTYDYEGKIMSIPSRQGGNIKVFNIKSFFKTAPKLINKTNKLASQHKPSSTSKVSTINTKRLVNGQSKMSFNAEDFNNSKLTQKTRIATQNNLMDLFKSGKQVQMGVSITDLANKSKIKGESNCKEERTKMNLSQFKQIKSAFKSRARNLTQMIKNSEPKELNEEINYGNYKRIDFLIDSDVESKQMSSSFSHLLERTGKIKKNDRAYTQNFSFG